MKYGAAKILKDFTRVQGQLVARAMLFLIVNLTLVYWWLFNVTQGFVFNYN